MLTIHLDNRPALVCAFCGRPITEGDGMCRECEDAQLQFDPEALRRELTEVET
jgi:predicted amidophosphoribosyltransferase